MGRHHGKFDRPAKIAADEISAEEQGFYESGGDAIVANELLLNGERNG